MQYMLIQKNLSKSQKRYTEVYNPPTYLFSLYTYMEKDLCRGVVYFTVLCDHPCLFPYFMPFWYPYILLHFQMFFISCKNLYLEL